MCQVKEEMSGGGLLEQPTEQRNWKKWCQKWHSTFLTDAKKNAVGIATLVLNNVSGGAVQTVNVT